MVIRIPFEYVRMYFTSMSRGQEIEDTDLYSITDIEWISEWHGDDIPRSYWIPHSDGFFIHSYAGYLWIRNCRIYEKKIKEKGEIMLP